MKPRHGPDTDSDDEPENEEDPEVAPDKGRYHLKTGREIFIRHASGRSNRDFSNIGRDVSRSLRSHINDQLIAVNRSDGSYGLIAPDDPQGFRFTTFNTAEEVTNVLKPKGRRKPKKRSKR